MSARKATESSTSGVLGAKGTWMLCRSNATSKASNTPTRHKVGKRPGAAGSSDRSADHLADLVVKKAVSCDEDVEKELVVDGEGRGRDRFSSVDEKDKQNMVR